MAEESQADKRFEKIFFTVFFIMVSGITTWVWDIRKELSELQRIVYERKSSVEAIPIIQKEIVRIEQEIISRKMLVDRFVSISEMVNQQAVQQSTLNRDVILMREMIHERFETINKQIQTLWMRAKASRSPQELYEEEGP